jgi:hypothetical protein
MKHLILFSSFLFFAIITNAQNPWELGGEYMKPIGKGYKSNIGGLRYEKFNNKTSFSIGLTYHFAPKDAYGGFRGYGLWAGFRNSFGNNTTGSNPFIGARLMLALENFDGKTSLGSLMVTPMAEAGYHFVFGKHIFTTPSIGWGYQKKLTKEFNSRNDDEGGRIIPGLAAGYRF